MNQHCCEQMVFFLNEKKVPIKYFPKFREYSIELYQKGVFQDIYYCPWCGKKLPESLRDKWFSILEETISDFDGPDDQRIPNEFSTDAWWIERNL